MKREKADEYYANRTILEYDFNAGKLSPEEIRFKQYSLYEEGKQFTLLQDLVIANDPEGYVDIRYTPDGEIIGRLENGACSDGEFGVRKNIAHCIFRAGDWIFIEYEGTLGYVLKNQVEIYAH